MRRLTLILSDLYLPEDSRRGTVSHRHELPALEWLLRFARAPEHIDDWRRWLLCQAAWQQAELPVASICGHGFVPDPRLDSAWMATPVHLEARLDYVHLLDRGLLRLAPAERSAWCAAFGEVFAPQYTLHDCGERAFVLTGLTRIAARTVDPAKLLGAEIGPSLPDAGARELRRLWAEIEMWLHGSALNQARERAGQQRISALWLWGQQAKPRGSRGKEESAAGFHGGDPLIGALARKSRRALRVPESLAQLDPVPEHSWVEFAPMTGGPHESLPALETNWFAPARDALGAGRLDSVTLVANDRVFRIDARDRWKFWRRRVAWLDALGHVAGTTKA